MGLEIERETFGPDDFERFHHRLERCLSVLETLLERPAFGEGDPSLGAELEVALVDGAARPLPLNQEVLCETLDERLTVELDRFNLECNLRHTGLAGNPFRHLRREMETALAALSEAAARHGGRVAMIGILPTLREADLTPAAMTDSARYRALSRSLRERRDGPFRLDIAGESPLRIECEDVTFEGAATSFQLHLRVHPREFKNVFNAVQFATAPMLAAAGNSPLFLGHRLWSETRVALFKQAVDDRGEFERRVHRPARVSFGESWLQDGPIELFREAVRGYPVLLPILSDEEPESALRARRVPELTEIRLHQGTVWHWNRPVYDGADGGHVRIELRALPSGPSIEDMVANAAFLIGLSLGLAPRMEEIQARLGFDAVRHNFYRAARSGLDAPLEWPAELGQSGSVREIFPRLGVIAREGLRTAGVDQAESDPLIECVLERVERGQTGSAWQRARLASLEAVGTQDEALGRMLEEYMVLSASGDPVHRWSVSPPVQP